MQTEMDSFWRSKLEKLESHFNWNLGESQYRNKLRAYKSMMETENEPTYSPVHFYNLLGFIQQALGFPEEALLTLQKAESTIQEAEVQLQVTKANLAWVYFHRGDLNKAKEYVEEVERLQQVHPAPPDCALHPEVSGEKAWTLEKFYQDSNLEATHFFKMALKAEPDRKEWQKGLAIAMSRAYSRHELTEELNASILEQVKRAAEMDPSNLFLQSFYVWKKSEKENTQEEINDLLERAISTENLTGLHFVLKYFERISLERGIEEAERVQKRFPSSSKVSRILAKLYLLKVLKMKGQERRKEARKVVRRFETVLKMAPCGMNQISLAMLHGIAGNIEKANELYKKVLSEENDFPPHSQQFIYYSYACHLFLNVENQRDESINYHMKAAEINIKNCRYKSIQCLEKIVRRGTDPRCEEILAFLTNLHYN